MPWICLLLAALWLGPDLAVAAPATAVARTHVVQAGETLYAVATRYGVSVAELRQWNRLRGDRITVGQRLHVRAPLPTATVQVRKGETLAAIAARHGTTAQQLRRLNRLRSDRLLVGQRLKVPRPAPIPEETVAPPKPAVAAAAASGPAARSVLPDSLAAAVRAVRLLPVQPQPLPASVPGADRGGATALPATATTRPESARAADAGPESAADSLPVAVADSVDAAADSLAEAAADSMETPVSGPVSAAADSLDDGPPEEYTVQPGDSLPRIAARFEVSVDLLRQLNRIKRGHIHPGQRLRLRPSWQDEGSHVVQPGETLSAIATRYGLDVRRLRELNGLEDDRIAAGRKLRLRAARPAVHLVERGDALWEIAAAYGMDPLELKRINNLTSDRVYPGQELRLSGKTSERYGIYVVQPGDNLTEIANLHQMSVAELKRVNKLRGSVIQPGQRLKTRPLLGQTAAGPRVEEMDWAALPLAAGAGTRIEAPNGPYYGHRPAADRQTQARYFESSPSGPLATYQEAIRLWRAFEDAIARLAPLSSALQGWYVVIDPGHGGLDPGAVVEALDGSGGRLYVVEDEYAFDTAIRAYVLLRLHGARVAMTVLSPNHLVRHSTPPVQTYVNEKNEVYNNLELNQPDRRIDWPRGANLEKRVRLARRAFDGTPKERRIFLSFHADIDPHSPPVPLVLYYTSRNGRRQDLVSRAFARGLLPSLGAGARTRGQPLGVLRDNPAQVKVLLELRNLAYIDQAWALRFEQLRQRDAEKVVRGVLEYARRRPLSARR